MATSQARLLVVGAGGIGCELLKNVVIAGIRNIHVIDLDTIDVSNLNRQFLFRRCHVGMSKAEVACDAARDLRVDASIVPHHANIKDAAFDREFFRSFDIVLNALDNREARRHVNRLCLMTDRPLIEAGSTGFNGQVMPILGRVTECYECHPPPREKSFPICTIRSSPDKPEHCIAWAKYLFEALFGPDDESNLLDDMRTEFEALKPEGCVKSAAATMDACEYAKAIFSHIFVSQIAALKSAGVNLEGPACPREFLQDGEDSGSEPASALSEGDDGLLHQRRIWSLAECREKFVSAFERIHDERRAEIGTLAFRKEDADAMDFVAAAANVRMFNFHIPRRSRWDIQTIAGAIIPAVASTNAIVAGVQTVQMLHVLKSLEARGALLSQQQMSPSGVTAKDVMWGSASRFVWVKQFALGRHIILPEPMSAPNGLCFVCQQQRVYVTMKSIAGWTLKAFVERVVKRELGCSEPLVEFGAERKCVYDPDLKEEEPEEFERQALLSLEEWGFGGEAVLFVTDFSQDFQCDILVTVEPDLDEDAHPDGFKVDVEGQRGAGYGEKKRRISDARDEEQSAVSVPAKRAR